jgi:CHRD domain
MRWRLKLAAGVAVLGVAGIGTAAIAHDNSRFDANLTGYEETPTLSTSGTGTFKAWINRGKDEIRYVLTYAGPFDANPAGGTVTQAHIHLGAPAIAGGVVAFLCTNLGNGPAGTQGCPGPHDGTISGTFGPSDVIGPTAQGIAPGEWDELLNAIDAGKAYANVHSTIWPGGEIRAQLNETGNPHD